MSLTEKYSAIIIDFEHWNFTKLSIFIFWTLDVNDSVNILFFFWVYVGVLLLMISKLMVFVVSFAKAIVSDSNSSEEV